MDISKHNHIINEVKMDKIKAIEIALENEQREGDFCLKQSEKTETQLVKKCSPK